MTTCIEIKGLNHRYRNGDQDTLRSIDLTVEKADIFGLLGPNGAGKTTLISVMTGILSPQSGTITYYDEGKALTPWEVRRHIGYVPQEYAFYQELTPRQNLAYFGAMYDLPSREAAARSEELMEILGLLPVIDKKTASFSGGMKRRVNLAIGILHGPKVLFLDEPTVGVDVQSKHAIIRFLKDLNRKGTTIVYTSHHLAEAEEICNRIALLDQGRIIAYDQLSVLLGKHRNPDLQSLFLALTGVDYRD